MYFSLGCRQKKKDKGGRKEKKKAPDDGRVFFEKIPEFHKNGCYTLL
jgi:hypothetical protein